MGSIPLAVAPLAPLAPLAQEELEQERQRAKEAQDEVSRSQFHPIVSHPPMGLYRQYRDISQMVTLWLFNIAMENGPFIDGLPIKNGDFPWLC